MGNLFGGRRGECGEVDSSLLFLLLVILFCNCGMFGYREC